jgi:hypothetical protein
MKYAQDVSLTVNSKPGTMYWRKPDSMRVVALNDPGGKKNLGSRFIPCLKLRGMWMALAGFAVGSRVTVEISPGCITLRLAGEPSMTATSVAA